MINYLIVDDEPIAHEIIEEYAENLEYLTLKKHCYNVFQAIEYLNKNTVDLVFLDIEMPKINGFEFLKSLSNPPKIIVTTAYKEYALEGYELEIVDYLLKPFSLQRFLKAIDKVYKEHSPYINIVPFEHKTIFLKDSDGHHQVVMNTILFVEALGNYTKVFTENKVIITLEKLSSYLEKLSEANCIQVHKSYIVVTSKIEQIKNNKIIIGNHQIPIGQTYKNSVTAFINK
ncbi:LytR/AlgR family response regulator transcription factor [Tenacibaculum amylolyticum]|uniref:LytR/AlgR family response regulator transcription factor n=1 Tax=Tenacibaculum amylolyticum TaxID=104269 RepID=UPI00389493CF